MSKDERKGKRQHRQGRSPKLGYYLIFTDTEKTEYNYFCSLRDSLPDNVRNKLVIKIHRSSLNNILKDCIETVSKDPQYRIPWLVFDRDRVDNFDEIINESHKSNVYIGWSNPCVEIWFSAYFGSMPVYHTSTQCNTHFRKLYKNHTDSEYDKSADDIYEKLCRYGNEIIAIKLAHDRYRQQGSLRKPSEMLSTTTLHLLIDEIRNKIQSCK